MPSLTRRDYAASLGLAIAGSRGRLSREAHAAIAKAEAEGMSFSDAKPAVRTPKTPGAPQTPRVEPGGVEVEAPRTSPEGTYWYFHIDGKRHKVNDRQVCTGCGVSLSHHQCHTPRAVTMFGVRALTMHE